MLSSARLTRDDEQTAFLARLDVLSAKELPSRAIEVPLADPLAGATWGPPSTSLDRGARSSSGAGPCVVKYSTPSC